MRNLKKFLALVLATMMLLSVAVISTSAAGEADYTDAANHLAALQVMKGNENGDLMLGNGVTRYQAALFFVQALTGETDVAVWNADKKSANFTDVVEYGTAIDHANGIGIVKGRGNGVFGYNDAIIYQDMLVMAVRALGYETEDMSYPYGYILAAQKLGLTENVDLVNYKAALTRGETAQIIWDMLGTEIAAVDPLTDKVLYPGEKGLTDAILGANGQPVEERVTLLVDSGLAGAKLVGYIDAFEEADEDDEDSFDVVTVVTNAGTFDLAAADFGIDAETRKVNYLGLPVELFVSVDAEDFTQDAYNDEEAEVVFASFPEYTAVVNLSADGDVKYVVNEKDETKNYLSIGGKKFADDKYEVVVGTFGEDGWVSGTISDDTLKALFAYEDGEYVNDVALTTYAQVAYREIANEDNPATEDVDESKITTLEVLYTPFTFGQYNVREINEVKYTVIGTYSATQYTNLDGEKTNWVEKTVDGKVTVSNSTEKISGTKGEAASTVVVEGEAVEAGDFMFYVYNSVDNVLTVAMNCGTLQTGRLNTHSPSKETVKINGTNYEFGFAGSYDAAFEAEYKPEEAKAYMSALEAGKDNVEYILVDGKIVYIAETSVTTTNSVLDYAIITLDAEIMADLLDMTDSKYAAALAETTGLYVEDGEVKAAMMNLETGKWELVTIAALAYDWVAEDEEFETVKDLANAAEYAEIVGTAKYTEITDAFKAFAAQTLVAVAEVKDGAYTIADTYYTVEGDNPATEDVVEESYTVDFFVSGPADANGISFSNTSAATNKITADDEVDAERVTVDEETVIIVVDLVNGVAGSRVGVQSKDNSYPVTAGYFLAASSDLIVLVTAEEVGSTKVADWADAATANADENWYIATAETGVEVEANEDEETWTVTYTNLYDMKAMAMVESIQTVVEDIDDAIEVATADILFKTATDELVLLGEDVDINDIIVEVANDNEDRLTYTALDDGAIEFTDAETIKVVEFVPGEGDEVLENVIVSDVEATDVNMTVITLNLSELDLADFDFDEAIVPVDGEDADTTVTLGEGEVNANYFEIALDLVDEINEPTEGVFDENAFGAFVVPSVDSDNYADGAAFVTLMFAAYNYDAEEGVLNVVVYKLLVGGLVSDLGAAE